MERTSVDGTAEAAPLRELIDERTTAISDDGDGLTTELTNLWRDVALLTREEWLATD